MRVHLRLLEQREQVLNALGVVGVGCGDRVGDAQAAEGEPGPWALVEAAPVEHQHQVLAELGVLFLQGLRQLCEEGDEHGLVGVDLVDGGVDAAVGVESADDVDLAAELLLHD